MILRGTGISQGIKYDKDISSCHHLLQHMVWTNLFAPPVLLQPVLVWPQGHHPGPCVTRGLRDGTQAPGLQMEAR